MLCWMFHHTQHTFKDVVLGLTIDNTLSNICWEVYHTHLLCWRYVVLEVNYVVLEVDTLSNICCVGGQTYCVGGKSCCAG